ncbi:MAG: ROK family protein, partial [Candidatus Saccharimonadales bacterium]
PDIIIIGGSMGTFYSQYGPQLEALLAEKLPPYIVCPTFMKAKNPEEAVIYGCYYYAIDVLAA